MRTPKSKTGDKKTAIEPSASYIGKLDQYFGPRLEMIFWICFSLSVIFGIVFFDLKVSIGGDDSMYINRAFNFIHKGTFPTFQGPLYPMFLGVIILIFGLNLVVLKICSLLFILGHLYFFHKVFSKHLSPFLHTSVLLVLSINASYLYYASTTYTEPLFLLLQAFVIFLFDKYFLDKRNSETSLKTQLPRILIISLVLYIMYITRSMGLSAFLATFTYFLIEALKTAQNRRNWLVLGVFLLSFAGYHLIFKTAKTVVWNVKESQMSSQMNDLLYKNYYDKSEGKETFSGYVQRFITNSKYYLSHHTARILGLKETRKPPDSVLFTLVIVAILISGFILTFKTDPFWTYLGLYLGISLAVMFVILQVTWNQERLIIPYFPLLLAYFLQGQALLFMNKIKALRMAAILFPVLFVGSTAFHTLKSAPTSISALQHYLRGDRYYGFTPDWVHYLQMAEWCSKNLPESSYVGCRKPGMAFIYSGGKEFYGIWRVPSQDSDELYQRLKDAGVTHVIMANLRVNPDRVTNRTINTVRRYLGIIHGAYPDKLEFVHKIGESEPAFLYELH